MNIEHCIQQCTECHRVCVETLQHCLEQGGHHVEPAHVREMLDCAQICAVSADFMSRGSDTHIDVCGVCAHVCQRCAESCEKVNDSAEMQRCIDACRACAQSCREMTGAAVS